jgi:hypothetical protein
MSASDEPKGTVTIMTADELQAGAKVAMWFCTTCGRVVLSETVWVDEHGALVCMGCRSVDDLDYLNDSNIG